MSNKYEYYSGELPKTKIVKIRTQEGVVTYTKEDIERFVAEEGRKIALEEIEKIRTNYDLNKNNDVQNDNNYSNINNFNHNDIIISVKNLYEERIRALEKALLDNMIINEKYEKVEEIKQAQSSIPSPMKKPSFVGKSKQKRKQKHFFEIKEHNSPKLKKSDIEKK